MAGEADGVGLGVVVDGVTAGMVVDGNMAVMKEEVMKAVDIQEEVDILVVIISASTMVMVVMNKWVES